MKNITLSANEELIASARQRAAAKGTTLNQEFRDWLAQMAAEPIVRDAPRHSQDFEDWLRRLSPARSDGSSVRDEPNARIGLASHNAAENKGPSISQSFREWLNLRETREEDAQEIEEAFKKLSHIDFGGPYTRDEMHER
jgi:hypothetical protein